MHDHVPTTEEDFSRWNDEMAVKYNPDAYHRSPNPIVRWIEGTRVRKIISFLDLRPTDHVLEVGCGAGNILERIPAASRTGIDLSPSLLELARKRLPQAHLILGNAEAFPPELLSQRFERVYCSEVLEHVLHPRRVVEQMAQVLAPDGIVVVSLPNEGFINAVKGVLLKLGVFTFLFPGLSVKMDDEWHVHAFDQALLRQTVEGIFRVERIAAVPFPWFPVRYVARLRKI